MAGRKVESIKYDYLPEYDLLPIPHKYVIGLTGNIGSGKSTAAKIFKEAGAVIIDADRCARELQQPGQEGYRRMMEAFGPEYFAEDGSLDRKRFGALVFADDMQRRKLNCALLPLIVKWMHELAERAPEKIVVLDAPLLLETGMEQICDAVCFVAAEEDIRTRRVMEREQIGYERAHQMVIKQIPQEKKILLADIVIDNNGTLAELKRQVVRCLDILKKEKFEQREL